MCPIFGNKGVDTQGRIVPFLLQVSLWMEGGIHPELYGKLSLSPYDVYSDRILIQSLNLLLVGVSIYMRRRVDLRDSLWHLLHLLLQCLEPMYVVDDFCDVAYKIIA